jgi:hypothetical protein
MPTPKTRGSVKSGKSAAAREQKRSSGQFGHLQRAPSLHRSLPTIIEKEKDTRDLYRRIGRRYHTIADQVNEDARQEDEHMRDFRKLEQNGGRDLKPDKPNRPVEKRPPVESVYILKDGLPILARNFGTARLKVDPMLAGGLFSAIESFAKDINVGEAKVLETDNGDRFTFTERGGLLYVARSRGGEDPVPFLKSVGRRFTKAFPDAAGSRMIDSRLYGKFNPLGNSRYAQNDAMTEPVVHETELRPIPLPGPPPIEFPAVPEEPGRRGHQATMDELARETARQAASNREFDELEPEERVRRWRDRR